MSAPSKNPMEATVDAVTADSVGHSAATNTAQAPETPSDAPGDTGAAEGGDGRPVRTATLRRKASVARDEAKAADLAHGHMAVRSSSRRTGKTTYTYEDVFEDDEEDIFGDKILELRELQKAEAAKKKQVPKIDRILADRENEDGEVEFFCKWQDRAYLHAEWVTEQRIIDVEKTWGRNKIKRYWQMKPQIDAEADENGGPFDPDYTEIERIVAMQDREFESDDQEDGDTSSTDAAVSVPSQTDDSAMMESLFGGESLDVASMLGGDGDGGLDVDFLKDLHASTAGEARPTRRMALVKWRGLGYSDATWEAVDLLENVEEHVERYQKWNQYPQPQKPPPRQWQRFEESPAFKDGNTLRSYQLEGLNWLVFCWYQRRGSILADEMGLGKTVQTVATLDYIRRNEPGKLPMLVVAPLSTIGHWAREFEAWTDLNVITYQGSTEARELIRQYEFYYLNDQAEQRNQFTKFDVLLTSYEMCVNSDWIELAALPWQVLAVDEAQRLKNINSKLASNLRAFKAQHRILLTGTPLQNNITELWTLLNFIEPDKFASIDDFLVRFGTLENAAQVTELHRVLQPHLLRRLKEDVEKSIPPKEETVMSVELTRVQKQYYRALLDRNRSFLNKGCRGNNVPNLMNVMMALRKVCNHPWLMEGAEDRDMEGHEESEYLQRFVEASGKLVFLDKLLPRLHEGGHRVLIFSQMVRVLDLLETYLNLRHYKYERLDGGVRGTDRQSAIDRFSKPDSDRFVFLLCTRAGGVGINLTAADTVVIYDSDWNPQNDIQAQARCHRIGQKKEVKVYRLVTNRTYEEQMIERASKKLGLDQAVLQSGQLSGAVGSSDRPRLKNEEVDRLLRHGAYHVFNDDDTDAQAFSAADIDTLLQRSKKVVWQEGHDVEEGHQSSSFSKASFVSEKGESIDIDDKNFWSKIMPEQKTAEKLLATFLEQREALGHDASARRSLYKDMSELVYEAVDAWDKGKGEVPSESVELVNLVNLVMETPEIWESHEVKVMEQWVDSLDTTRRRRGRTNKFTYKELGEKLNVEKKTVYSRGRSRIAPTDDDEEFEDKPVILDDAGEPAAGGRKRSRGAVNDGSSARRRRTAPHRVGVWTDPERRKFVEALFDLGTPSWDTLRTMTDAPQRTDTELYELSRYVLQQCAVTATTDEDRETFRGCLDVFIVAGSGLDSSLAQNPRDVRVPTDIATDKFEKAIVRHNRGWARKLRELAELVVCRDRMAAGTLVVPPTPNAEPISWWTTKHDIALVDGIGRYGMHGTDKIATDPTLPMATSANATEPVTAEMLDARVAFLTRFNKAVARAADRDLLNVKREQEFEACERTRDLDHARVLSAADAVRIFMAVMAHGEDLARVRVAANVDADSKWVQAFMDVMLVRARQLVADMPPISASDASAQFHAIPVPTDDATQPAADAEGRARKGKRSAPKVHADRLRKWAPLAWMSQELARQYLARLALLEAVGSMVLSTPPLGEKGLAPDMLAEQAALVAAVTEKKGDTKETWTYGRMLEMSELPPATDPMTMLNIGRVDGAGKDEAGVDEAGMDDAGMDDAGMDED